jgi:Aerotolerance regulator N-terminal/von Willebrand factor type A domain
MNFLAPLFLLGALAVGLPIVFHLIRRSSREEMPFSSLMFLQPSPPRVTKRSRLEHILLLLLRCLVIALLALAFARPFFEKPMLANPSPDTGRKVIVLIDTSASMRREGVWAAAVDKAGEVLKKASPDDDVALFTFDTQLHQVLSFEQWAAMNPSERPALAAARVAQLKPGWAGTHLGAALIGAAEAFTEADKQGQHLTPQRIVLITDLQEGSRLDGLQGYDWPRGTDVQVERLQARRPTNAGLQWVADSDQATKTETSAGPRIRVSNSANAQREQFQLRWEGVAAALPLDLYVPPGQSRLVQAPKLPAGATGEQLRLTGDDDDFDNALYILQPKAEQVHVLFLGNETEKDPAQPLFYLKRAFQQTARQAVELAVHPAAAAPLPAELTDARLLIATDRLPDNQVSAAQTFLSSGGTMLFVAKSSAAAETIGKLAGTEGLAADEVTATNYAMLGLIDFEHPLFAPFADPRYNDFTKIHFWKYRRLDTARLHDARVLARFESGDPALVELPVGKGRLFILASGWQPADSQLALSSKFVPLLFSMLDLAGGMKARPVQFHVGDTVDFAGMNASPTGQPVSVRKPDGTAVELGSGETRFSQTDQPGIYAVASVQPPLRFAVNLDPSESRTAPLPIDQLERLGVPLKPREVEWAKQVEQKRQLHAAELENQQKLWRWLTFLAVVVLLVETWLAGWLTRRTGFKAGVAT